MKGWSGNEPNENHKDGPAKSPCAAEHDSGALREKPECVTDDTKEIALLLLSFWFFHLRLVHDAT